MHATLMYGSYAFSPVGQVGIRQAPQRLGDNGLGAGVAKTVVTIKGKLYAEGLNAVQTKIWQLEAAFKKHRQQLYWHDGTTTRINNAIAQPVSLDVPADWSQYEADYTVVLEYMPLDETHNAPFSVSYGSYVFSPIPVMGREFEVQRDTPQSERGSTKVTLTLNGFFDKTSEALNRAEINTLMAALASDDTLTYGGFVQSVRYQRFSHSPVVGDRRINWTLVFDYDDDVGGDGVIKMQSSRRITRVTDRIRPHKVPFRDGSRTQNVGESDQQITATGFVVAETLAEARSAADTEIDAQFPANGLELEGSTVTENAKEKKVEWNVTKLYESPALRGGVYGKE